VCDLIQGRFRVSSSSLKGDVLECILHRPLDCLIDMAKCTIGWAAESTVEGEGPKVENWGAIVVKGGPMVERGQSICVSNGGAADVGLSRPTVDVCEGIGSPGAWSLRWWGGAGGLTLVEGGGVGDWEEEGAWGERERSPGLTPQLSPEEETEDVCGDMGVDDDQVAIGEKSEWRMERVWVQDLGKCVDATPIAFSLSRGVKPQRDNGIESNVGIRNCKRNDNGLSMVIAGSHANILRSFELHVSKLLDPKP
jgi:hypothetical protein